jgi:hypothetical protein
MVKLSFWQKLAFLANLCWLATWAMKFYNFLPEGEIRSTILVTGLLLAYILNITVNFFTGLLFIRGKLPPSHPRWIIGVNFLFLLPQLYLFFK